MVTERQTECPGLHYGVIKEMRGIPFMTDAESPRYRRVLAGLDARLLRRSHGSHRCGARQRDSQFE